ncbi:hypothetical protein OG470_33110 [Micromonospora sp. NBC_00389]|uniref:hypothetical protein n=1 Tax=Micromonospora sp. NBC_00389 TaxID=2903586 RepID=UPI002E1EE036
MATLRRYSRSAEATPKRLDVRPYLHALLPLSLASLLTGLIQSLGTRWGLFRHYWLIAKLAMNLIAVGVLLLYMQTLAYLASAARGATSADDLHRLRGLSPVVHGGAAVVLLLTALVLSVVKPRGLTGYGQGKIAAVSGGGVGGERYSVLR